MEMNQLNPTEVFHLPRDTDIRKLKKKEIIALLIQNGVAEDVTRNLGRFEAALMLRDLYIKERKAKASLENDEIEEENKEERVEERRSTNYRDIRQHGVAEDVTRNLGRFDAARMLHWIERRSNASSKNEESEEMNKEKGADKTEEGNEDYYELIETTVKDKNSDNEEGFGDYVLLSKVLGKRKSSEGDDNEGKSNASSK